MQLQTTLNQYIASNNVVYVNPDNMGLSAVSYDWWTYLTTDKVGNLIFNNANYSSSTNGHQSDTMDILRRLGIVPAIMLTETLRSGCSLDDEIDEINTLIRDLEYEINRKGTWRKTNADRQNLIQQYRNNINDIELFRDNYWNKKLFKPKADCQYKDKFKPFFINDNGKLDTHGFAEFCRYPSTNTVALERGLPNLTALFNLKNKHIRNILNYQFLTDTENMVPGINTNEYVQLKNWLKRMKINRENITPFYVDKIHEYLTAKMNRVDYKPSEPVQFPIQPFIKTLQNEPDLKLLDTDRKLRAEGRRQHHCIGSREYIDGCIGGNHALNYRGHTFYLNEQGEILAAHGSRNSPTPWDYKEELSDLISHHRELFLCVT